MIHTEQHCNFDTTHRSVVGQIRDSNAKELISCKLVCKGALFMPFGDGLYQPSGHESANSLKFFSDQRMLHGSLVPTTVMTNVPVLVIFPLSYIAAKSNAIDQIFPVSKFLFNDP